VRETKEVVKKGLELSEKGGVDLILDNPTKGKISGATSPRKEKHSRKHHLPVSRPALSNGTLTRGGAQKREQADICGRDHSPSKKNDEVTPTGSKREVDYDV